MNDGNRKTGDPIGIISYGAYIPFYRLPLKDLSEQWGRAVRSGEKAVANWDEDSLTMGVEAALDCMKGLENHTIDAVFFSSSTPPYRQKQSASLLARVVGAEYNAFTLDLADSLRAGTSAVMSAVHFIRSHPGKKALVVASDLRIPAPDSDLESNFGDGAAAFLLGDSNLIASIEKMNTVNSEFMDQWRREDERFYRIWEDRFNIQEGLMKITETCLSDVINTSDYERSDFTKVLFHAPDARSYSNLGKFLGFHDPERIQNPFYNSVGHTGTAFVPMLMVSALEESSPNDRILVLNYSDGCDALCLHIEKNITALPAGRGMKKHLVSKDILPSYGKYMRFRRLYEKEPSLMPPFPGSLTITWRQRHEIFGLVGHQCRHCGTVQFPKQRVCTHCRSKDHFNDKAMSKKGVLFTFSIDERQPIIDPPLIICIVELEKGGRFPCSMTDRGSAQLKAGMAVELTFRNLHTGSGVNNYFWRCRPIRE